MTTSSRTTTRPSHTHHDRKGRCYPSEHVASARVTKTQAACPPWCQVSPEQHEAEAWDKIGSWFTHVREAQAGGVTLMVMSLQPFEEQVADDEAGAVEGQTPGFFIDITPVRPLHEEFSASEALEVAQAIERFVKEVSDTIS